MTNTKLEFIGSPQDVTVRELLNYTFTLDGWLGEGEEVTSATARMVNKATGTEIAGVTSGVTVAGGNAVRLTVDWTDSDLVKDTEYRLWVKAQIGSQFKEGFADFTTYYQ